MSQIWEQFIGYFSDVLKVLANAYSFLGGHKWAAAIITLTLIVRTLLLPIAMKQIKSMREQQRLQPEVARLRQKYAGDRQKMTEELMELYRREGVNPYAACLPMIAQMPVFIGMYWAIRKLTELPPDLAKTVKAGKLAATKALEIAQSRPGGVPKMPFLGLGDLAHPASSSIAGWALIVIMTAAQLLSTRQLNVGQTDQQRRMQMLLPLFFLVFFIRFPTGLVLYWATQSLYQLVQQWIMTRDMRPPGSGWRGLLGLKTGAPAKQRPAKGSRATPPRAAPVAMATSPANPSGSPSGGFEALGPRRDLAEKRARRRRRKKKKRKR